MSRPEITPALPEDSPPSRTEAFLIQEDEAARHRVCVANTSATLCMVGNLATAGALAFGMWKCLPLVSARAAVDPPMRFGAACLTGGAIGGAQIAVARAIAMNRCGKDSAPD